MIPHLKAAGVWHQGRVGRLEVVLLRCRDVQDVAADMASRGLFCYHDVPASTHGPGR